MKESLEQQDEDDMEADLPPPKRRKTLAGSIVSTALSAALIGTAVGLTVYRLWKGKGRQTEVPPPPYEEGGWIPSPSVGHDQKSEETSGPHYVPVPQPDPCEYPESSVSSSAHRRRQRHVAGRRTLPRQRKVHSRAGQIYAHTFNFSPSHPSTHSPIPAEFSFGSPSPGPEEMAEAEDADEMDWIGDRLAKLIEEGKRALGKEIVVAAETEEDQEDDGSGQWIEEDGPIPSSSSASFRKSRGRRPTDISIASPPPQYITPQHTPRTPNRNRFDSVSRPSSTFSSPNNRARAGSVDSASSILNSSYHEDESAWQSPEIREAMERARQSFLQRRQMAS